MSWKTKLQGGGEPSLASRPSSETPDVAVLAAQLLPVLAEKLEKEPLEAPDLARRVKEQLPELCGANWRALTLLEQRALVARLSASLAELRQGKDKATSGGNWGKNRKKATMALPVLTQVGVPPKESELSNEEKDARKRIEQAKIQLQPLLLERIDSSAAAAMSREELTQEIAPVVADLLTEVKLQLNRSETTQLVTQMIDEMLGLGPLEPLLADDSVNDIMVNGFDKIFVERSGKLQLTNYRFRDNSHVMAIATRIVTAIGRRIDESQPLVDARLADGSRVNIIIPPLALDGPSISIRKFSRQKVTLEVMARQGNISDAMRTVLQVAARSRLNILISGGTGSGKTTLLNALSQMIDPQERIVTIEDAAELQLQQPHVVRLETRSANLEGGGEIPMRQLLKNALRMRPDRIIVGEIRGEEAVDMLQAMNTGHDGSLSTLHANRPRDALMRLENMIGLAGINLPAKAVRTQIASAVDMIIQVSRMRDGMRRITHITEIVGMEGDVVTTQDLYTYDFKGEKPDGSLDGEFKPGGVRPHFTPKAAYFGLDRSLLEAL
ncbi:CpaF family protein [Rhodovibrionaceae bacterium A322]